MTPWRRAMAVANMLTVASCAAAGAQVPGQVFSGPAHYAQMWWTHGLRDPRGTFSIQTSRYVASFDAVKIQITHLAPLAKPPSEAEALLRRNEDVFDVDRPNASLRLTVQVGPKRYQALGAGPNREDCHLVESGRFFHRRWFDKVTWPGGMPNMTGGVEVAAWPDRLAVLLRLRPAVKVTGAALEIALDLDNVYTTRLGRGAVQALTQAGGAGFVAAAAPATATLSCDPRRSVFTVRLPVGDWSAGTERTVGLVLWPEAKDIDTRLRRAVAEVDKPLKVTAVQTVPTRSPLATAVDRALGWHTVSLRNDRKARDADGRNRRIERVMLTVENPSDFPRPARLCFEKVGRVLNILGLSAMLCDTDGYPAGLDVQISKNWHASKPDHVRRQWQAGRYRGPWYRGLTVLRVPARTKIELMYVSAGALWGGLPAASHAQLCLVGWGGNQLWEQAAIGSWGETLCFDPDQNLRGAAVCDTRPLMVWAMGTRPRRKWTWTHNVGGAGFLVYHDRPGHKQWPSRMRTRTVRNGPVLTEAVTAGRSADDKIDLRYTVSLYRTDDIARGIYRFRYDVRKPVTFERLVLFQCGGDDYSYTGERKFAWGNETGLQREWSTNWGGNAYKTRPIEVAGRVRWFSMHRAVRRRNDHGAWANRGIIMRRWRARLGGRPVRPWAAERGARVRGRDTSLLDIIPPPSVKQLEAGDFVTGIIEHVVMPQRADDYYGPNDNLRKALTRWGDTWRMIHREAMGNDLGLAVSIGTLERSRPTKIRAKNDRAEFTIRGGLGAVPITITGLSGYRRPRLEMRAGATHWKRVDQAVHGKDFWQTDYDVSTGTWEITYSVPLDTPADTRHTRSFRFRLDR